MTIRELMAHTAGLSYGIFSQSQVDTLYNEANVLDNDSTLKDMIDKLSKIPLRQQPGSMWHYSVAVDVQGLPGRGALGTALRRVPERAPLRPLG